MIQRFNINWQDGTLSLADNGTWCRYEDHEAEVSALRSKIQRYRWVLTEIARKAKTQGRAYTAIMARDAVGGAE